MANHHIAPGKKQWTWGNGDFGCAWDRQLTDEDGPYIELMCGVYTDNQPDFTWLMPGEEKSFSQYFMPYKGVGVVRNANVDAAVGLELDDGVATRPASTRPASGREHEVVIAAVATTVWTQVVRRLTADMVRGQRSRSARRR